MKRHCYVSMMDGNAYSEVLNHNDDANDLTRGIGKYSLEQFFDFFFGPEEYVMFKKYTEEFTEKVKDYFGYIKLQVREDKTITMTTPHKA